MKETDEEQSASLSATQNSGWNQSTTSPVAKEHATFDL